MSRQKIAAIAGLGGAIAIALLVYGPALRGPLISDDNFLLTVPQLQTLSFANLRVILDPGGPVSQQFINYGPVHALAHAAEIQLFGVDRLGYHVVNVALHAGVAVLLAALLLATGIPAVPAAIAALLFLLHPANVEAVAWISQLKTLAAAALALGALIAQRRHPIAGALLFALALLAKPHAAFALPVMAAFEWSGWGDDRDRAAAPRWHCVGVWAALFAIFAAFEIPLFLGDGVSERPELVADPLLHARTVVAIAARYLVIAATGIGVSTLHEPPLPRAALDPWFVGGLVALVLLAWRTVVVLRARSVEAAYWIWAAAAFAPVCQIFPFWNMMGDRYLYFILPGLMGGSLLFGRTLLARPLAVPTVRLGAVALALALAAGWGVWSHDRAAIWRSEGSVRIDAARHYPDGITSQVLRAQEAARRGDAVAAGDALAAAYALGWKYVGLPFIDPAFAQVRPDPAFRSRTREIAGEFVTRLRAEPSLSRAEWQLVARGHICRGERLQAIDALERALATGDRAAPGIRAQLAALRAADDTPPKSR